MHRVDTVRGASDIVTVDGIPCTNIARTLCDLGAVASRRHGRAGAGRCAPSRRERAVDPRDARPSRSSRTERYRMRCDACSTARTARAPLPDSQVRAARRASPRELDAPAAGSPVAESARPVASRRARLDLAWPDVEARGRALRAIASTTAHSRQASGPMRATSGSRAEGWELLVRAGGTTWKHRSVRRSVEDIRLRRLETRMGTTMRQCSRRLRHSARASSGCVVGEAREVAATLPPR